ncbi:hypothetical protein ACH4OX_32640 [Streptomyces roseolus]|uniref:hypothetical protein n=1 Tax=Streptomyces roseolus TaxID=67358 RepID=UPI0037932386
MTDRRAKLVGDYRNIDVCRRRLVEHGADEAEVNALIQVVLSAAADLQSPMWEKDYVNPLLLWPFAGSPEASADAALTRAAEDEERQSQMYHPRPA